MKQLFLFVLLSLSLNVQAQLKSKLEAEDVNTSDIKISTPIFKSTATDRQPSVLFNPKVIKHNLSIDKKASQTVRIEGTLPKEKQNLTPIERSSWTKDKVFGANSTLELMLLDKSVDDLGMNHYRYQTMYRGIPIYGDEVLLHISKDQYFINGRSHRQTPEAQKAVILAEERNNVIEHELNCKLRSRDVHDHLHVPDSHDLVYVEHEGTLKLAHHSQVHKNIAERWELFIDAVSGKVLIKNPLFCTFHNHNCGAQHSHDLDINKSSFHHNTSVDPAGGIKVNAQDLFGRTVGIDVYESGGSYYLIDASRTMYDANNSQIPTSPVGSIWTIDAMNTAPNTNSFSYDNIVSSSSNFSGKNTAVSAHYNGGKAYEYFKNVHNRESINGSGGNIISLINVANNNGTSLGNAFWNGAAMFYGNGDSAFLPLARGLDVAGHEMSHGVIQSTANLQYMGESGALNESFADIFGSMIDRDDWLIGEDVVKSSAFPSGALRSMKDPHNGASTGQYNKGWQPKHYNERYTGSEDRGGVHINSGIPNHAFYLFATSNNVGKDRAEKVYFRALTNYLTKSSQFIDARVAVVKAAKDLYGDSVADAAKSAFSAVGIQDGQGGDYENDVETNNGNDYVVFTLENGNGLFVTTPNGEIAFNPLTEQTVASVPSVTDDGTEIVFVNKEKQLRYVKINWDNMTKQESALSENSVWRNAVFSKDGNRIAAVTSDLRPEVFIYDFTLQQGKTFVLSNPTYSDGVQTGDVQYCDAMEFDFTGEYLMYDALNKINSTSSGDIEYWDIGFIKVFEEGSSSFAPDNQIQKLFSNLSNNVSIGNPTFSKNSPYIIAFDYVKDNDFAVLGANTETNKVSTIFDTPNQEASYPSYTSKDDGTIFTYTQSGKQVIASIGVDQSKIKGQGEGSILLSFQEGIKWGTWFNTGERDLVDIDDVETAQNIRIYPNPTTSTVHIASEGNSTRYEIVDMNGKQYLSGSLNSVDEAINVAHLPTGVYTVRLNNGVKSISKLLIKK